MVLLLASVYSLFQLQVDAFKFQGLLQRCEASQFQFNTSDFTFKMLFAGTRTRNLPEDDL